MKSRRLAALRRRWTCAALLSFAALRTWSVVSTAGNRIAHATAVSRETAEQALARYRDAPGYLEAIRRIRGVIPPDGTYFLVDEPGKGHVDYLVRFDLAPRRAVWLEDRARVTEALARFGPGGGPAYVVVAHWGAVELVELPDRRSTTAAEPAGADAVPGPHVEPVTVRIEPNPTPTPTPDPNEDPQLYGNLDSPAVGQSVTGELSVQGWARIAGQDLEVTFLVDGRPCRARTFRRVPRPDVAAALPAIGGCDRAGFEAVLPCTGGVAGEHTIQAIFHAADGRQRHLAPTRIRWMAGTP